MQIKPIFSWKVLHKDDRFETDHKGDSEVAFHFDMCQPAIVLSEVSLTIENLLKYASAHLKKTFVKKAL